MPPRSWAALGPLRAPRARRSSSRSPKQPAHRRDGESTRGSNRTMFGEWFGVNSVAWCNIFVSYCFRDRRQNQRDEQVERRRGPARDPQPLAGRRLRPHSVMRVENELSTSRIGDAIRRVGPEPPSDRRLDGRSGDASPRTRATCRSMRSPRIEAHLTHFAVIAVSFAGSDEPVVFNTPISASSCWWRCQNFS